jgi:hypothetical protein
MLWHINLKNYVTAIIIMSVIIKHCNWGLKQSLAILGDPYQQRCLRSRNFSLCIQFFQLRYLVLAYVSGTNNNERRKAFCYPWIVFIRNLNFLMCIFVNLISAKLLQRSLRNSIYKITYSGTTPKISVPQIKSWYKLFPQMKPPSVFRYIALFLV